MLKTSVWQGTPQQTMHYMKNCLPSLELTDDLLHVMTLILNSNNSALCHISPMTFHYKKSHLYEILTSMEIIPCP